MRTTKRVTTFSRSTLLAGMALAVLGCVPQKPDLASTSPSSATQTMAERATSSSWRGEIELRAAWGSSDTDLGRTQADESNPEGPMSFALASDGSVLVLDQVNLRVQRYKHGAHVGSMPLSGDTFQDLAIIDGERLVLLDRLVRGELVFVRSADGHELSSVLIEGAGLPEAGGVTGLFVRPDGVWLEREHTTLVKVATLDGAPAPVRSEVPGRFSTDGKQLLQAARDGRDGALIQRRDAAAPGAAPAMSQVRFELPVLYMFALESDAAGQLYLGVHLTSFGAAPDFPVLDEREEVVVLGPDGRTRGRVALMANTGAEELFSTLRVSAAGHLYHLVADDLGVTVWRYVP